MGGYDFPGQITTIDGSEGIGTMGTDFIVLDNPTVRGSVRVVRTEEGRDSTRSEMTVLLEDTHTHKHTHTHTHTHSHWYICMYLPFNVRTRTC